MCVSGCWVLTYGESIPPQNNYKVRIEGRNAKQTQRFFFFYHQDGVTVTGGGGVALKGMRAGLPVSLGDPWTCSYIPPLRWLPCYYDWPAFHFLLLVLITKILFLSCKLLLPPCVEGVFPKYVHEIRFSFFCICHSYLTHWKGSSFCSKDSCFSLMFMSYLGSFPQILDELKKMHPPIYKICSELHTICCAPWSLHKCHVIICPQWTQVTAAGVLGMETQSAPVRSRGLCPLLLHAVLYDKAPAFDPYD